MKWPTVAHFSSRINSELVHPRNRRPAILTKPPRRNISLLPLLTTTPLFHDRCRKCRNSCGTGWVPGTAGLWLPGVSGLFGPGGRAALPSREETLQPLVMLSGVRAGNPELCRRGLRTRACPAPCRLREFLSGSCSLKIRGLRFAEHYIVFAFLRVDSFLSFYDGGLNCTLKTLAGWNCEYRRIGWAHIRFANGKLSNPFFASTLMCLANA
jgi:hypothetical protein